jgi:hypothetical protein
MAAAARDRRLVPAAHGLSWALAGAIAVVVGTLVALDYRGVAKRIPWVLGLTRLGWSRSVGARRRAFAGMAVWGVVMILLALR